MTGQPRQRGGGRRAIGDISPKLAALTDDVLFDDIWNRPELSPRDRSLITVTALIAGGHSDQLPYHLNRALENGVTQTELLEAITHLAFYAGWPKAMTAVAITRDIFGADDSEPTEK
jgi:4-carboxymuconolactone decarboxylase